MKTQTPQDVMRAFDLLAPSHASFVDQMRDDPYTARVASVLRQILPDCRGLRVLDLGGGNGNWARWFTGRGCAVVLSDLSMEMLKRSSVPGETPSIPRICMDISRPAVRAGQFDVFLALGDVLSYVPDPVATLCAVRALARPGQWLIGTVISRFGMVARLAAAGNWQEAGIAHQQGWFIERSTEELARLATGQGMAVSRQPLIARLFGSDELLNILHEAKVRVSRLVGLNIASCLLGPGHTGSAESIEFENIVCESPVWRDHSTNLLFVGRWQSGEE